MEKRDDILDLNKLLQSQTLIVQQLGLYLHNAAYTPSAKEVALLEDIAYRADDTKSLCRYLEYDFFRRMRQQ